MNLGFPLISALVILLGALPAMPLLDAAQASPASHNPEPENLLSDIAAALEDAGKGELIPFLGDAQINCHKLVIGQDEQQPRGTAKLCRVHLMVDCSAANRKSVIFDYYTATNEIVFAGNVKGGICETEEDTQDTKEQEDDLPSEPEQPETPEQPNEEPPVSPQPIPESAPQPKEGLCVILGACKSADCGIANPNRTHINIIAVWEIPDMCKGRFTCSESDTGLDYYTKGTAVTEGQETITSEDYCDSGNTAILHESVCVSLHEKYCQSVAQYVEYTCPNGCRNGACVASS